MSGLVTTIIPVFNRAAMLVEAVNCVISQTYRPIEILIVDDGSTDDTASTAAGLAVLHPEVRVLTQKNGGPGMARERARIEISGEFVQHLDSDDLIDPGKFELQVAALRAHPECGVAYSRTRLVYPDGSVDARPSRRTGDEIGTMFPAMLESRFWETASPLYRSSLFREAGPWMPLRAEEDWEYDCRIAARGVSLCFIDEWLSSHRRHDSNISGHMNASSLRDRAQAHEAILRHARRAGIGVETKEMQHFARELFLLSRQAGAAGLNEESRALFSMAREASGPHAERLQFRLYSMLATVLGWKNAGVISRWLDALR